jgi:hypothetical protein
MDKAIIVFVPKGKVTVALHFNVGEMWPNQLSPEANWVCFSRPFGAHPPFRADPTLALGYARSSLWDEKPDGIALRRAHPATICKGLLR